MRAALGASLGTALAGLPLAVPARAQDEASFAGFLAGVRAEARRAGIRDATLAQALGPIHPNQRVIELDRRQPEFTMTWAQYKARVLTDAKLAGGRAAFAQNRPLLLAVDERFRVTPGVVVGIWGMETNYGAITGGYNVVEALATLAWEGRRASFFRQHLITALKILDSGDVAPSRMLGSYAGAMGQPQFMPDSYMRFAVDFDGDGRRDIWSSRPDVLASIANYLARSGWRYGEPWGQAVLVPPDFNPAYAGREGRRTLGEWTRMGVRRADGSPFTRDDVAGAVVMPDGAGGEAYMTYANFNVIRRYNPSDYYALGVGLLGEQSIV